MTTERFSMNNFTPLTFLEKKANIEEQIELLQQERHPVVAKKKEIDEKLAEYNSLLKESHVPDIDFSQIQKAKTALIREKSSLEQELMRVNDLIRKKHKEIDRVYLQSKRMPDGKVKEMLLELREKYMAFSSDTTRVASMRAMSSRFLEEIQSILKYVE